MRIATGTIFSQGIHNITRLQSQTAKTQNQLATGQRVLTPADDPVAATKILRLGQEINRTEQYQKNVDFARSRQSLEETTLKSVESVLGRVRELILQANNTSISASDRNSIAQEIRVKSQELANLANTRDASGEYIFAGFQSRTEPFVERPNGGYSYQGDDGQRQIKVSENTSVAITDSGQSLFVDVPLAQNTLVTDSHPSNSGDGVISMGRMADYETFESFYGEDYIIEFRPESEGTPNGPNYSVRRASDGMPVTTGDPATTLTNVSYTTGETIEVHGFEFEITGSPDEGDQFTLQSSSRRDVLSTFESIAYSMENLTDTDADGTTSYELRDAMEVALQNVDNAFENIIQARSEVGSRLKIVDSQDAINENFLLESQKLMSEVRDLDYAEAISRLNQETFILEAAQASFSRISNLSLINFIR